MAYSATTIIDLTNALAIRLTDPNNLFWQTSELQAYVIEALRTWNAHVGKYNTRVSIPTQPGVLFYNLFSLVPALTPTVTDRDLIQQIQRHLQEPVNPTGMVTTDQFSYQAIVNAIQKRRDKFFLETGMVLNVSEIPGPTPPDSVVNLDGSVIGVARVMWKTATPGNAGVYSIVWKTDQFMMTAQNPQWLQAPGIPMDYSTILQHPLKLQLSPPPNDEGFVNLLTMNSGPVLSPSISATVLGIADDFCWIVKYGALADLFVQEGPGQDLTRAAYCEGRWKDGIALARITNFVRLGYQNGTPTFVDSMEELDTSMADWVSALPNKPIYLGLAGNIVATSPIPDKVYSLAFDIMPSFPIPPISPTGFVQLGQETLDVILDYAQHLALLKEGGDGLTASMQLYKNLVSLAAEQNDELRAAANDFDVLSDRSLRQWKERPRRKSDLGITELDYAQD